MIMLTLFQFIAVLPVPSLFFFPHENYTKFTPTKFYSVNACTYYNSSHSQVLLLDNVKMAFDTDRKSVV